MKKTPNKGSHPANASLSPITLPKSPATQSSQRNLTGTPRLIRDIVADLYNNIQSWNSLHIEGSKLVKEVTNKKSSEPRKYTAELEQYMNQLNVIVHRLESNINTFQLIENQCEAVTRLINLDQIIFFSLTATQIYLIIKEICSAYSNEYKTKEMVLDNIAHMKSEGEALFLAACWTHQLSINERVTFDLERLLIETGHRQIQ